MCLLYDKGSHNNDIIKVSRTMFRDIKPFILSVTILNTMKT